MTYGEAFQDVKPIDDYMNFSANLKTLIYNK